MTAFVTKRDSLTPVALWLLVCCALIFAMVVIGGITRLTESGLSITEWKPITGTLPPLSEAAWQEEFAKYQRIPQYQQMNAHMTLADFKSIFWWEYIHRLWGRLIGAAFLIPFLWFAVRGKVRGALAWRLGGIFALGALQGGLGWYMVASGLADRINVSPYRLTAHLGLALLIYAAMFWTALDLLRRSDDALLARHRSLWRGALALNGLVFLTILAGGFVAGLRAGMTYNTFPLMDGRLVPAGYLDESPWWINLFENVAAVQFNHRVLAITTLVAALAFWFYAWRSAPTSQGRLLVNAIGFTAVLQVALGIATLLLVVPVALAALHQAGALALLTLTLAAAHVLTLATRAAGPAALSRSAVAAKAPTA